MVVVDTEIVGGGELGGVGGGPMGTPFVAPSWFPLSDWADGVVVEGN
jgi:hypothetical protein